MNSFVDINVKRRRHQLGLHPSSADLPLYARYILAWSKPEPNLNAIHEVFLGRGSLSIILFRCFSQHC